MQILEIQPNFTFLVTFIVFDYGIHNFYKFFREFTVFKYFY